MTKIKKSFILVSTFLAALVSFGACNLKGVDQNQPESTTQTSGPKVKKVAFKDGTYEVNKEFQTPGGINELKLKILLEKEKVKNVIMNGTWSSETSRSINEGLGPKIVQNALGKGYNEEVDAVSGATLSSKAFNESLKEAFDRAKA